MKFKRHHYGRNWGGEGHHGSFTEIVVGRYRIDIYWEPLNNPGFHAQRWAFKLGPLTVIAQNWKKRRGDEGK